MNWGTKIAVSLALFMALIISFGIYMVCSDTDTLVADDYYERGLRFDEWRGGDTLPVKPDSARTSGIDNDEGL